MRIRRTILDPAILVIGTTGALAVGPVLALTAAAAQPPPRSHRARPSPT